MTCARRVNVKLVHGKAIDNFKRVTIYEEHMESDNLCR